MLYCSEVNRRKQQETKQKYEGIKVALCELKTIDFFKIDHGMKFPRIYQVV